MPQESTPIYRSTHSVLGGVCAGIAEHYDMDAALIRIFVVLSSVVTLGVFALVYLAAWLILPPRPESGATVDVSPESFRSEVYEQVVMHPAVSPVATGTGAAFMPPTPPASVSAPFMPQQAPTPSARSSAGVQAATSGTAPASGNRILVALAVGVVLIVLGAAALFSSLSGRFALLQFWPLVFVAFGIVRIVVPARDGTRAATTILGALVMLGGVVALASTLGLFAVDIDIWITRAAPFLLISLGLFTMGRATHSNVLIAAADIALALFLAAGMLSSFEEATTRNMGVSLPFDPEDLFVRMFR
ncbi:MAG: PspC domain-containing protein [Eggerthellaceae bacterium]|nr:PspC domain-containing protein [Eggerthellaceae bacterium]